MIYFKVYVIIFISVCIFFSYVVVAAQYGEDYYDEEDYYDDYPPVDIYCWPDLHYILEVDIGGGIISRQYIGNRTARLETISDGERFTVIYQFDEEQITQINIFEEIQEYIVTLISYEEFFDLHDDFEPLFYKSLPGEELAMSEFKKVGDEYFLGRKVEVWTFYDGVEFELLIDRELRQFLKIVQDGEVVYEITRIELKELSQELFTPPDGFVEAG